MRLKTKIYTFGVTAAIAAGLIASSGLQAGAAESPAPTPIVASSSSPGVDESAASVASGPRTMAGDLCDNSNNLGRNPSIRQMAIRAACFWKGRGLPRQRIVEFLDGGRRWTGGGEFMNRQGRLPTGKGRFYFEYDMNATPAGVARDAMRVIVDIYSGSWWYTDDHYRTFTKFVLPSGPSGPGGHDEF